MKKLIALVLSLVMIISAFGMMTISAANDEAELYEEGNSTRLAIGSFEQMFNQVKNKTEGSYIIKLVKDATLPNTALTLACGAKLTIDGNNTTITAPNYTVNELFVVGAADNSASGDLTIKNVTINDAVSAKNLFRLWDGTLTLNNVNVFKQNAILINAQADSAGCVVNVNVENSNFVLASTIQGFTSMNSKNGDVNVSVKGSTIVNTGVNTQHTFYVFDSNTATANENVLTIENCNIHSLVGRLIATINQGDIIVKDSTITMPFVYGNDQNKFPIKVMNDATVSTTIDNVNFYGGTNNGVPVSYQQWFPYNPAAGDVTKGITYVDYDQAGQAGPTTKLNEAMLLPKMQVGASVRIAGDTSGIRFTTDVTKAAQDYYAAKAGATGTVSYGTIVLLASDLEKHGVTAANIAGTTSDSNFYATYVTPEVLDVLGIDYLDIVADKGVVTNDDGSITFRAAVKGFEEDEYDENLLAFSYAKVVDGDNVDYYCSPVRPTDNVRSMKTVAVQALADTTVTFNDAQLAILNKYAGN